MKKKIVEICVTYVEEDSTGTNLNQNDKFWQVEDTDSTTSLTENKIADCISFLLEFIQLTKIPQGK